MRTDFFQLTQTEERRLHTDMNNEEQPADEGRARKMTVNGITHETVLTDTPMTSAMKLCDIFFYNNTLIV